MNIQTYRHRYRNKNLAELRTIHATQSGDQDTPSDCLYAVEELINERMADLEPDPTDIDIHPDYLVAKQYINKATSCRKRGIDFQLSWNEYKAIKNKNSCFYTGIKFDESDLNRLTIDRIDSSIGYTRDNSVACANQINALKESLFECEGRKTTITAKQLKRMAERLIERGQ